MLRVAQPKTIELCIHNLEERMRLVRENKMEPPRGYQKVEWLRESHRQLLMLKQQRMQSPIG